MFMKKVLEINRTTQGISIPGHGGTWSCVDSATIDGEAYYLMQNDRHGRRLERIVLDERGNIVLEDNEDVLEPYVLGLIKQRKMNGKIERQSVRERLKRLNEDKDDG